MSLGFRKEAQSAESSQRLRGRWGQELEALTRPRGRTATSSLGEEAWGVSDLLGASPAVPVLGACYKVRLAIAAERAVAVVCWLG